MFSYGGNRQVGSITEILYRVYPFFGDWYESFYENSKNACRKNALVKIGKTIQS